MLLYLESSKKNNCYTSSNLTTELIKEIEVYLIKNENATFYHHPLWLKVISKESDQDYYYIIHRNSNNEIDGVLPLMKTKGLPFGIYGVLGAKRLSSLPRTPYCGPIASNQLVINTLLFEAHILSKSLDCILQIKSNEPLSNPELGIHSYEWRKNFIKDIPKKGEQLLFRDHKTERDILRNIKRAKANGIELFQAQSIQDVKIWYGIYLEKMRFHGVPARPFIFFEDCWNILKPAGLMDINLAVQKNSTSYKILAGNINFKFKSTLYGGFKAGDMKNAKIMYGDYIMFNEFLDLQENSFNHYDLGEVSSCSISLERYKKKWGVKQTQLYHSYLANDFNLHSASLDADSSNDLLKMIWRHIPLKMTGKVGTVVNKFL